jgi:biopolymer transport protein ExbD
MSSRRRRKKKFVGLLELNITAMCDVIFLLLIYLLVGVRPTITLAQLDVKRPTTPPDRTPIAAMLVIDVTEDAFAVNGKRLQLAGLKAALKQSAEINDQQTVAVKSSWDASHARLVAVLDSCSEAGLNNVSVFSM